MSMLMYKLYICLYLLYDSIHALPVVYMYVFLALENHPKSLRQIFKAHLDLSGMASVKRSPL